MKPVVTALVGLLALSSLSGCVALAAAGAGYTVADEIKEGDGKFDPLEKVRGKENESN